MPTAPVDTSHVLGPIAPPAMQATPCVLVVDDERINRELLKGILKRNGYQIILAASGEEALRVLPEAKPDLVLLDVNMAPMNGFDVLRKIRESHRDTELPVLMVTAESDRNMIIDAFREGANDYLTKPVDPEITLARVSLHLRLRIAQVELQRSQERYLMAAEGSQIGLWDWDLIYDQLYLSPRWRQMLGYSDRQLEGSMEAWSRVIHANDLPRFLDLLVRHQPGEQERFECELRMLHQDGNYRWMQCSGIALSDSEGRPRRIAGSLADITKGKVRDPLTGLPNRLLFEEKVEQALHAARSGSSQSAVLFLDLDKFKIINDSLGHDAGDLLLCEVARRLEDCVERTEQPGPTVETCIARHGGDEFTVLLQNVYSPEGAQRLASAIIRALSEPFQLGVHEVSIGVSIGIAFSSPEIRLPLDLIRQADTAMYCAKTGGRGRFRVYDPEMQLIAAARLALENDVRNAIRSEQFQVVYQPIYSLTTHRVESFEALSRWRNPQGQWISPDVFVPILESLGLIGQLGEYVLSVSSGWMERWNLQRDSDCPLTITVNCSALEFSQPHFSTELLQRIRNSGISPESIRLEVTESVLMKNPESARRIIEDLKRSGIKVGLDDFGTGYSSLAYLHRLPLDLLKIDRSFVHSMQRGNEGYEIVRTIISLAKGLNLDVVAEGVETYEQHVLLTELGCTHAQGYLYSHPIPAEDVEEALAIVPWAFTARPSRTTSSQNTPLERKIDALLDSLSDLTNSETEATEPESCRP